MDLFTTGDGCQLAYRFDGAPDKAVLMLSNSIGTTHRMWDKQIPDFIQHFRVLRYDARGHGASDAPSGPYSLDRLGWDVIELLDALDLAKVHFCGLSVGGMTGQWLGIHQPERIDRLVLANTSSYFEPRRPWDARINDVLNAPDLTETAEMLLSAWLPADMLENNDPAEVSLRSDLLATSTDGVAGSYAVLRDADLRRTVTLINRPTLVIAGEHDQPETSKQLAATIPDAQLITLEARHLSNVGQPGAFNEAVLNFLALS